MVERGARFIELTCPNVGGDRWDQHGGLKQGHENNARAVDQPIAALLKDLKARGLLDDTLVVWAGEFGRTPFAQGGDGRDHNPFGFTIWLAGGGVKAGFAYGETDEWGYKAVVNKVEIHDLHATMLHLLGVDHKRLTVRFGGRDMRLTDVHGEIIKDILAYAARCHQRRVKSAHCQQIPETIAFRLRFHVAIGRVRTTRQGSRSRCPHPPAPRGLPAR